MAYTEHTCQKCKLVTKNSHRYKPFNCPKCWGLMVHVHYATGELDLNPDQEKILKLEKRIEKAIEYLADYSDAFVSNTIDILEGN